MKLGFSLSRKVPRRWFGVAALFWLRGTSSYSLWSYLPLIPNRRLAFFIELILCLLYEACFSWPMAELGPFSGLPLFFYWFILRLSVAIDTFLMDLSFRYEGLSRSSCWLWSASIEVSSPLFWACGVLPLILLRCDFPSWGCWVGLPRRFGLTESPRLVCDFIYCFPCLRESCLLLDSAWALDLLYAAF